jgi:anhydro-N-acetylmuramic acid kinase
VEHDPARGITVQIGHESALFASSPIPVVGDFRSASVARGGQGAPLVPIADRDLFDEFEVCVNLGGFSNASWTDSDGMRRAGDLGPCNGLLNGLASELDLDYDPDGMHAAQGSAADDARLRAVEYYHRPFPKSLGREWMEQSFMPEFAAIRPTSTQDALATASEHIAWTLAHGLRSAGAPPGRVLLSGGGALNADLVRRIANQAPEWSWQVAHGELLQAKEALAFAYLGLLRLRGEPNVLQSYAGGSADGCDGIVFSSVSNI